MPSKGTARPVGGGKHWSGKGKRRIYKAKVDAIQGITKPAIRRLARRGGVKRISAMIYEDARSALRDFLTDILRDIVTITDHCNRSTVLVRDVIFTLRKRGRPIWGFDPNGLYVENKRKGQS